MRFAPVFMLSFCLAVCGCSPSPTPTSGTVQPTATVATPVLSPGAGTYTGSAVVQITDTTSGAAIYFTTNGTTPTSASTLYNGPIAVNSSETITAITVATGDSNSATASAAYVISPATSGAIISTFAGNGVQGFSGDGGPATSAELYNTGGNAFNSIGDLYIAAGGNNRIRMVTPSGIISTVAGNGTQGFSGDGGPATSAALNVPYGVAVDSSGDLYIADTNNSRVRKVNTAGVISTIAGNGSYGFSGDGGPASSAVLSGPNFLAIDSGGNLYISDALSFRIRKVNTSGIISTVAGNGTQGNAGDGGAATSAELNGVYGIAVDNSGNLYIADESNRIRKVNTSGIISTVAGNGTRGYSGDGGAATSAELAVPNGVTVDSSGNLYISDTGNNVIRKVNTSGIISTIAGNGTKGYSGDGGAPTSAELNGPWSVVLDSSGSLYISDNGNNVVRKMN